MSYLGLTETDKKQTDFLFFNDKFVKNDTGEKIEGSICQQSVKESREYKTGLSKAHQLQNSGGYEFCGIIQIKQSHAGAV